MKAFWSINEFLSLQEAENTAISRDLRMLRNCALGNKRIVDLIDHVQTETNFPFFQTKVTLIEFFDSNRDWP
jgi:hypothetical protein